MHVSVCIYVGVCSCINMYQCVNMRIDMYICLHVARAHVNVPVCAHVWEEACAPLDAAFFCGSVSIETLPVAEKRGSELESQDVRPAETPGALCHPPAAAAAGPHGGQPLQRAPRTPPVCQGSPSTWVSPTGAW